MGLAVPPPSPFKLQRGLAYLSPLPRPPRPGPPAWYSVSVLRGPRVRGARVVDPSGVRRGFAEAPLSRNALKRVRRTLSSVYRNSAGLAVRPAVECALRHSPPRTAPLLRRAPATARLIIWRALAAPRETPSVASSFRLAGVRFVPRACVVARRRSFVVRLLPSFFVFSRRLLRVFFF